LKCYSATFHKIVGTNQGNRLFVTIVVEKRCCCRFLQKIMAGFGFLLLCQKYQVLLPLKNKREKVAFYQDKIKFCIFLYMNTLSNYKYVLYIKIIQVDFYFKMFSHKLMVKDLISKNKNISRTNFHHSLSLLFWLFLHSPEHKSINPFYSE
jgi:hypothetical protein